jgi:pantoate kinase
VPIKTAKAFAPAGISSFFEICDTTADGTPFTNLEYVGARGGGFGLQKGILTEVAVLEAKQSSVTVFINGKYSPEAETTIAAIEALLRKTAKTCNVTVTHKVEVPVGAGFGTSAGGALTAVLALKEALDLSLTYNQIGKIAHVAEVQFKTGLGTVGPLMLGGCILTLEPGAPGIAVIDRIPLSPDYVIVAGVFETISTRQVLSSTNKRLEVNRYGRKTLEAILDDPSVENFLACCLMFAEKTGFMTPSLRQLVRLAEKAGAVGSAQNMIGQAVHSLVPEENANQVAEAFMQVLPPKKVIISKVDFQGARLVEHEKI